MNRYIINMILLSVILFSAEVHAQTNPRYSIQLLGDANSFQTLSEKGSTPTNASVGLLYTKYFKNKDTSQHNKPLRLHSAEVAINYNVASTVDTLFTSYDANNVIKTTTAFGNSILIPGNSGQSTFFNVKAYFGKEVAGTDTLEYNDLWGFISGFYLNFNHASRNWVDSGVSVKASTIALSTGLFYDFIDIRARDDREKAKKIKSIYLGAGYTARFLVGDAALNSYEKYRNKILGSTQTSFHGLEIVLGAKIENARIELRIPFLSNNSQIPGLSGWQPNYQIGFTGGVTIR
jgi:hypothetical protein